MMFFEIGFSFEQDYIVTPCPFIPNIGATSLPAVPMGKAVQWRHGTWNPVSEFIEEMQYFLWGPLDISRMFGTDLLKLMYVFIPSILMGWTKYRAQNQVT